MQRKNFDAQHKAYLDDNVTPILEKMIGEILAAMPRNSVYPFHLISRSSLWSAG